PEPARRRQAGSRTGCVYPRVELLAGELACEGLDVEQAGRPLRGPHLGEDSLVRLLPPRPGAPAARSGPTHRPGLLAEALGRVAALQLLRPALRVATQS